MPRKRTPSPDIVDQDKEIVTAAAMTLHYIALRHGSEKLRLASELAKSFADAPTPQPKPRTRKPKAQQPALASV
jgi:hypothetical protein